MRAISAAARKLANKSANDARLTLVLGISNHTSPKSKAMRSNTGSPVDYRISRLKVIKRDGTEAEVAWNDFEANGLPASQMRTMQSRTVAISKVRSDKKVIKASYS